MKTRIAAGLGVLVLAAACGGGDPNEVGELKPYVNTTLGFRVDYPDNWLALEDPDSLAMLLRDSSDALRAVVFMRDQSAGVSFTVLVQKLDREQSLDAYVADQMAALRKDAGGATYSDPQPIQIGGLDAAETKTRVAQGGQVLTQRVILAVSGALDASMFGPPVFPELAPEVLAGMKYGIWKQQGDGPDVWRRSIYVYRKRGLPFPFFETFDLPDQNVTCNRRNVSTVPTQALTLMNNEWVLRQAGLFAARVEKEARGSAQARVRRAYELALGREPEPREMDLALRFLQKGTLADYAHVLLNLNEFVYMR